MERNSQLASKILKQVERCELCGSQRNLEVHHILPISIQPYLGIELDIEENMIVLCKKCHGLLTPHRLLTKVGLANSNKTLGLPKGTKIETKKAKTMKARIVELSKDFKGCCRDVEVMSVLKINRNTYYKYKRELKDVGY